MRVYVQPSPFAHRPPIELADCQNRACKLAFVTLSTGEHAKLTPAQIAGYARARARAVAL